MRIRWVAGAAALALVAAGCGSSGSDGGGSGSSGGNTSINVGYVPFADDAALFLAKENGIFAKHGLNAKLTPAAAPTAIVASMVSGQEQFGFVTTPVLINSNVRGTPIQCVSTVDGRQVPDPDRDGTALVAAKGSGITGVADLAGKRVAVVQLASLNALDMQALALRAGIDPKKVTLIQLPFPQMPAALAQGRVAAAVIVSPFLQTALKAGATVVNHPNVELFPGGTLFCLAATAKYLKASPKVVSAFHDAINEATGQAKAHPEAAKATLAKYLNITPTEAQKQILSTNFDPSLDSDSIQQMEDYMKQLGTIDQTVPPAGMLWSGAR
ncbi:MAG TPA: ABC transporter substrate-binding protein [Mycobacteriales bacterium]|nr:ABC transporter substrate-binding protein [Mycobacteriales bacterium]